MSNIFSTGYDDFMFPVTPQGRMAAGMILESCGDKKCEDECEKSSRDKGYDKILEASDTTIRSYAMDSVLSWISGGDYSYDALDGYIMNAADIDGDFEVSEEDEEYYADIWDNVPDALFTLGASEGDIQSLLDGPSEDADSAAARIGAVLSEKMDGMKDSDSDIIADFVADEEGILEGAANTGPRERVRRHGKFVFVRKHVGPKKKLSSKRRNALKKARLKAHTSAAERSRKKSMKL